MHNYNENFLKNVENILEEADKLGLSNFTFDLFDCIFCDILEEDPSEFSKNTVEAYANEIRNSLEIMNPELKIDIEMLEKMLKELESFLEIQ